MEHPGIAEFPNDTEKVAETKDLDHAFIRRVRMRHRRKGGTTLPSKPPFWNIPKELGLVAEPE